MNESHAQVPLGESVARALTLRCPRCGARGILDGWFKLKDTCPVCALGLRRAPEDDEWFGGYFVNLIASELLMIVVVLSYVTGHWPDVPWTNVEVLGVVMVIVSPIISYPFSKTLWVAVELRFGARAASRR